MAKCIPKPTQDRPKPGLSDLELIIFYINCSVKAFAYFNTMILSQYLSDAGWSSWDIAVAWTVRFVAKLTSPLAIGWVSDFYKIRVPLLSFSSMVVGLCDLCLPYVLTHCSIPIFMILYFLRECFVKRVICSVWITDWLPNDILSGYLQKLSFLFVMVHTFSCAVAALLYDVVDGSYIFMGYGAVSLVTSLTWLYHSDNRLGMKSHNQETSDDNLSVMDGPLKKLLPEKGCFLLGWSLFIVCGICFTFEGTMVTGIYAVGITYATSTEIIVSYSVIALIPITSMFLQTVSQALITILSKRKIASMLSVSAIGLTIPSAFWVDNSSLLLIVQYAFMLTASNFIKTVVFSILPIIFNEAWKARMMGLFFILRNCGVIGGLFAVTAAYEVNKRLLLPILLGCTILSYAFFLLASCSLPPEKKSVYHLLSSDKSDSTEKPRYVISV